MILYVARDKNGALYLFTGKPYKDNGIWNVNYKDLYGDNPYYQLDSNLFPEIKWEDTEPTEVELTIKNKV